MKYLDPENLESIIKDIMLMKTVQDVVNKLKEVYPDFIIDTLEEYSNDYPHFDINWRGMCYTLKVKKAFILIVDDFIEDDKHILIKTFCEVLTQAGFILRRQTEFIPCSVCKYALPTEEMYNKLKEANVRVPATWNNKCTTC